MTADSGMVDDGFGNVWVKCERKDCDLEVVRPGKVQCSCDDELIPLGPGITGAELRAKYLPPNDGSRA